MSRYTLREGEFGVTLDIEAETLADAREAAHDWAREGDYNEPESTIWVDTQILDENNDIVATVTTAIDPEAPDCEPGAEHDWQSPIELVGGIKENPGVWGHGGGVIIAEACMHCGCKRVTDTWAQRPDNGEQGLTSVKYEPGAYDLETYEQGRES